MSKREIKHPHRALPPEAYSAAGAIDGWVYVSGRSTGHEDRESCRAEQCNPSYGAE